jgi:hypothetical protein
MRDNIVHKKISNKKKQIYKIAVFFDLTENIYAVRRLRRMEHRKKNHHQ